MNYFELYPGDYLRDTSRLRLVEHGAFLRLLMTYYAEEQPLPAAYDDLYLIAGAIAPADKQAVRTVADKFFPIATDGLRHNARADVEIIKARKRIDTARRNGSKNKPSKNPSDHPPGNPAGMPTGNPPGTQRHTQSGEALHTPHATTPETPLRPQDSEGRALDLPDGIDPQAWADWSGHWQAQRKWSAQRQMQAKGHLRAIAAEGGNPSDVLRWALSRGLADLLDCHRRMKLDAAKAAADTKLPGESLADASYRRATEARNNGPANPAELPLTAALLAIGGPKR